jgi:hypothetical protein
MKPSTKHNLKWALPILLIRAPLMLPIVAVAGLNDALEPVGDFICRVIPGFRR